MIRTLFRRAVVAMTAVTVLLTAVMPASAQMRGTRPGGTPMPTPMMPTPPTTPAPTTTPTTPAPTTGGTTTTTTTPGTGTTVPQLMPQLELLILVQAIQYAQMMIDALGLSFGSEYEVLLFVLAIYGSKYLAVVQQLIDAANSLNGGNLGGLLGGTTTGP